jgi:D-alanyl-D-alanine carboxypeptidase/D-alanyl-D-alanine-endopeptidase (penicillin-binding protein 4)
LNKGQAENLSEKIIIINNIPQIKNQAGETLQTLRNNIGSKDALLVTNEKGEIVYSINADKKLVPASTLKILTSLAAIKYLGKNYRFPTEFYIDKKSNLKIKGYGDPFLVSEIISTLSETLSKNNSIKQHKIKNIILDDSYFSRKIKIPGNTLSTEPYDAPNGALCANFNTVFFKRSENGSYVSAETQTPLLPIALKKIMQYKNNDKGRIVLSHDKNEMLIYAGYLFKYFLNSKGIEIKEKIKPGKVQKNRDKLIYRYVSSLTLEQIISNLLEYSNNFIANQILIATGAKVFGHPGTLEKGVLAVSGYAKNTLNLKNISFVEGSGISRKNRISAEDMNKVLEVFEPYHSLMRHSNNEFYKTGTLKNINTRAGYIKNKKGQAYRFVVFINTPGRSTTEIMQAIHKLVDQIED